LWVDEVLQEHEDFLAGGRKSRCVWTFVQRIENQENWGLSWQSQQILQVKDKWIFARISWTIVVFWVELGKNGTVGIGLTAKLD
jgi:hypothetical protein